MERIATQQNAYSILGGGASSSTKCVTKQWLTDNFNNIDTSKLSSYFSNQLVAESDIVQVSKSSWSVSLNSNFVDSWGNSPTSQSNVTIENGAARLHSSFTDSTSAYLLYNLGDLLTTCTSATLQYKFNLGVANRNGKHGFMINNGIGDAGGSNNVWYTTYLDENSWNPGRGVLRWASSGGYVSSFTIPANTWYSVKIDYNFVTNSGTFYLDGIAQATKSLSNNRPTQIMLGDDTSNSFRGWIKDVSITVT